MPRLVLSLLLALALMGWVSRSEAHQVGLSRGDYSAQGSRVQADIVLARGDASTLDLSVMDEVLFVTAAGQRCTPTLDSTENTEADGLRARVHFDCPAAAAFSVDARFVGELGKGHRHLARIAGQDLVLQAPHQQSFELVPQATAPAGSGGPPLSKLVAMGVEHILTGWDHLVFLLGLLLLGGRLRALALTISAFTVAHSITLGLAAFGVWAPPSSIVEPAIAASIAFVGIENLRAIITKRASIVSEKRYLITFPFGLVHGFGFASALRELGMSRGDVPRAVLGFNLGVELGQLAVVVPLALLLMHLGKRGLLPQRAIQLGSIGIVLLGMVWFTMRVA